MTEDKLKRLTSNEDSQLFRESVGTVRRIQSDKLLLSAPKPKSASIQQVWQQLPALNSIIRDEQAAEGNEVVFFSRDGVQRRTIRKLKRGDIRISDCLDLHGLTEAKAQQEITSFIDYNYSPTSRYVMIIHGKGLGSENKYPTLKNLTLNVLKSHDLVLAYSSALISDGGTGALYILLQKK
ncbi:MAG: DNA mismatch repair protein MutS [Piscirickettsiaceae bacterium]|nr:MAG: DNA mismatch repair protein MutS [Piscirickettsiaceae bacterium]